MATNAPRLNIYSAIAANRWRTVALVAGFTAIVTVLAYFVGEYFTPGGGLVMLPFGLGLSAVSSATSYFAGDRIVLSLDRPGVKAGARVAPEKVKNQGNTE